MKNEVLPCMYVKRQRLSLMQWVPDQWCPVGLNSRPSLYQLQDVRVLQYFKAADLALSLHLDYYDCFSAGHHLTLLMGVVLFAVNRHLWTHG